MLNIIPGRPIEPPTQHDTFLHTYTYTVWVSSLGSNFCEIFSDHENDPAKIGLAITDTYYGYNFEILPLAAFSLSMHTCISKLN